MAQPTDAGTDVTRDLPPLEFRAAFQPGSVNADTRTAEVIWTTGARVMRGFFDRFWEELSLDPKHVRMKRLNNGAPLLDSHDGTSVGKVIGVVESARLEKGRGVAVVRFAKAEDDPNADAIFRKVKDGIIQNVSVGYRVHKMEKVEDGAGKIPVMRAVDWEPHELSVVPAGADDGAGFRSAEDRAPNQCVIVTAPKENRTMADPIETPVTPSAEDVTRAAADLATKTERERSVGLRQLVKRAKLGDELADEFVAKGTTLDAARAIVLDKLAAADATVRTDQHLGAEITDDARDKFMRGAQASLFHRAAVGQLIRDAQKARPDDEAFKAVSLDPGEFRGLSFLDLARHCLERAGVSVRGLDKMALIGQALTFRSGLNSTSDFAILLETTMNKVLLAAYATTPDSWRRFCAVRSVPDFRSTTFYRNGSFGVLDALTEAGEFKTKQIPDGEKTSLSISTKGNIIGITRKALVNDDLGAFNDLATRFGRAAALSIESDVYALISLNSGLGPTQTDAQPFFHSNRANVNSSGSALAVAGLDADRVIMAAQKDPAGKEILDLRPAILLVAAGNGGTARVLNEAQYDPVDSKFMKPNNVRGLFRDVVDTGRLSGNRRYLLADPSIAPAFAVAFLEGQQEPVLQSEEGWRVDGTEMKVRIDYGVAAVDPRGAVTNAGQ